MTIRIVHLNIEAQAVSNLYPKRVDGLQTVLQTLWYRNRSRESISFLAFYILALDVIVKAKVVLCNRSSHLTTFDRYSVTANAQLLFFVQFGYYSSES